MPELPAVEFTRRLIEEHCLNLNIKLVEFIGEEFDEIILSKAAYEFLSNQSSVKKLSLTEVGRLGKQLWLRFQNSNDASSSSSSVILIHLGMTGFVQIKGHERLKYASSPSNSSKTDTSDWPPRFCKLIFKFEAAADGDENGEESVVEMAYCDARRFGRIDYISVIADVNVLELIRERFKLGFDPIRDVISFEEFVKKLDELKGRRINMKTLLMEQSFVAGIGNWMADDILLAAGIRPQRPLISVISDPKDAKRLFSSIDEISRIAVERVCDGKELPKEWLFHIRWDHRRETLTGDPVESIKIGGRSTFWVPKLQK